MGEIFKLNTVDFGRTYTWDALQKKLDQEIGYRLPNAAEACVMEFGYQAIWVSDEIGNHNSVMDREWGIQIVRDGTYNLILVEE